MALDHFAMETKKKTFNQNKTETYPEQNMLLKKTYKDKINGYSLICYAHIFHGKMCDYICVNEVCSELLPCFYPKTLQTSWNELSSTRLRQLDCMCMLSCISKCKFSQWLLIYFTFI